MIYYIAYDISDTDARTKTAQLLENIGTRIQHSLFSCELAPAHLDDVFEQLSLLIDPECDSLHIYPVCHTCVQGIKVLGKPLCPFVPPYVLL